MRFCPLHANVARGWRGTVGGNPQIDDAPLTQRAFAIETAHSLLLPRNFTIQDGPTTRGGFQRIGPLLVRADEKRVVGPPCAGQLVAAAACFAGRWKSRLAGGVGTGRTGQFSPSFGRENSIELRPPRDSPRKIETSSLGKNEGIVTLTMGRANLTMREKKCTARQPTK